MLTDPAAMRHAESMAQDFKEWILSRAASHATARGASVIEPEDMNEAYGDWMSIRPW